MSIMGSLLMGSMSPVARARAYSTSRGLRSRLSFQAQAKREDHTRADERHIRRYDAGGERFEVNDHLGDGVEDALVAERKLGALEFVEVVLRDLVASFEADELDDLRSRASVVEDK